MVDPVASVSEPSDVIPGAVDDPMFELALLTFMDMNPGLAVLESIIPVSSATAPVSKSESELSDSLNSV